LPAISAQTAGGSAMNAHADLGRSAPLAPRVGHIGFLNYYPLRWGLRQGGGLQGAAETIDSPEKLSDALVAGELDISAISLVELLKRDDELVVLPDIGIASDGAVMSCLIVSRVPLAELGGRPVALGSQSRTTIRLAQLLFEDLVGVRPDYFSSPPDLELMLTRAPAAVLIGDAALRARAAAPRLGLDVHDLGAMWRAWTGLPFVFAMVAVRKEFAERERAAVERVHEQLIQARDTALRRVMEMSASAAAESGIFDIATMVTYYTEALDYTLTERHLAGLSEFVRRLGGRIPGVGHTRALPLLETARVVQSRG
jgi:chorismate dehydratase